MNLDYLIVSVRTTLAFLRNLPVHLERERERRGISARALARESGLSNRVINRTLNGEMPTANHAKQILDWMIVSMTEYPDTEEPS